MSHRNNYFTEDAHLSDEAIALYVDALRLNKVYLLPGVVLRHVADCRECKAEIVENSTLLQNQVFRATEPHPYFDQKVEGSEKKFSYAYRIAAVVIVGISIGFFLYNIRSIRQEQAAERGSIATRKYVQTERQNSVSSDSMNFKQEKLLANGFAVSPNLENLVDAQSRSVSVQVLSPANGEVLKQGILFKWRTEWDASLTLKILTNKEKTLLVVTTRESRYIFTQKIPPGLYYWKLESKDELLYVGKFFFR